MGWVLFFLFCLYVCFGVYFVVSCLYIFLCLRFIYCLLLFLFLNTMVILLCTKTVSVQSACTSSILVRCFWNVTTSRLLYSWIQMLDSALATMERTSSDLLVCSMCSPIFDSIVNKKLVLWDYLELWQHWGAWYMGYIYLLIKCTSLSQRDAFADNLKAPVKTEAV